MAVKNYHYEFNWILIGSGGVGKSSILGRIYDPNYFNTDEPTTVGTDFKIKMIQVEGKTIKIQLWDTAGQERYEAITTSYYRNVVGGFVVFDVKDRSSFDKLSNWIEDAKKGAHPREPVFVLVANKTETDKCNPRLVSQQEAQEFAKREMEYIETSAKTGHNTDKLLPFLANRVYWKLNVGHIELENGWQGVTKGDLCTTPMAEGTMDEHMMDICMYSILYRFVNWQEFKCLPIDYNNYRPGPGIII